MFSKKFWIKTGEGALVSAVIVAVTQGHALLVAGDRQQAYIAAIALGRACAIAALDNAAPRFVALKAAYQIVKAQTANEAVQGSAPGVTDGQ